MSFQKMINVEEKEGSKSYSTIARFLFCLFIVSNLYGVITNADGLNEEDFKSPPDSAKPHVWWHWMNGNVTRDGIEQDLAWMQRIGIGGVQYFDAALMTPEVVDKRIVYDSKEWQKLVSFSVDTAKKHDLDFAVAASPGFSETGGPWVEPADAMKKITWSEVVVKGGEPVAKQLAKPPTNTGMFQSYGMAPDPMGPSQHKVMPEYFRDIAVLAFPLPENYQVIQKAILSASNNPDNINLASDGSLQTSLVIESDRGNGESHKRSPWLQFSFQEAQVIRGVTLALPPKPLFGPPAVIPQFAISDDGVLFSDPRPLPIGTAPQYTITFPALSAKAVRFIFNPGPAVAANLQRNPNNKQHVEILDVKVHSETRVNRFEDKAGFGFADDYYAIENPLLEYRSPSNGIELNDIIDISHTLKGDGSIDWTPPEGSWRIIRFAYTLTGKENHPAIPEATGLEVDKFNQQAVRNYLNNYLASFERALGSKKLKRKGITALVNDSIEAGAANWTEDMFNEFRTRRDYELKPWLPALAGFVVEDSIKTDAFLYDFRKTLAEMLADNHYGVISKELTKRGLTHYAEALENGRNALGDDMAMRKTADIPMAAMWTFDTANAKGPRAQHWADMRGAASVAHVYGKEKVAAELLTSINAPWAYSPKNLQAMIDMAFAQGINFPILHSSVHQPLTEKVPGFSLGIFGHYFNRLNTWAEYAKPWTTYMARNAYMLRQGRNVADLAIFYGEEAPLVAIPNINSNVPSEHGFDFVNADIILNELQVEQGELISEGGARYKALYLGGSSQKMSLAVLKKLAELVREGGILIGQKPIASPSLNDDDEQFQQLANQLWSGNTEEGRIINNKNIDDALNQLGIAADFSFSKTKPDTQILFVHRSLSKGEVYFYTHRNNREDSIEMEFRVSGKKPMHWDAVTGKITPLSYRMEADRTIISKTLSPFESGYIVFLKNTKETRLQIAEVNIQQVASLQGDWDVSFQQGRGVTSGTQKLALGDWSKQSDAGIRYFSGAANYQKTFSVDQAWLKDKKTLLLNLGEVADLAEVFINGKSAGIVWKPPYRLEIGDQLKKGDNLIEIKVTNLWVNRLIGDQQDVTKEKITFTTVDTYPADAALRPSGLIGPVVLERLQ